MLTHATLDGLGMVYIRAEEPFAVEDFGTFTAAVARGAHPGLRLDMPALVDLRGVDLLRIPTSDIARYVMRRAALTERPQAGPIALVCGDLGSFGMLRMFGVMAELSGLRAEEMLCVTMEMAEAAAFLCARTGQDAQGPGRVLAAIAATAPAPRSRA